MTIKEIRENLYPEDRMIAAVQCECTDAYINMILRGDRNTVSDKALKVIKVCEALGEENKKASGAKSEVLIRLSEQLFQTA